MPERRAASFAASRVSGSMPFTLHGIPGFIRTSTFDVTLDSPRVPQDESPAPEFLPSLEVNVFGKYSVKYLFFSCIFLSQLPEQLDSLCPIHPHSLTSETRSTAAPT